MNGVYSGIKFDFSAKNLISFNIKKLLDLLDDQILKIQRFFDKTKILNSIY